MAGTKPDNSIQWAFNVSAPLPELPPSGSIPTQYRGRGLAAGSPWVSEYENQYRRDVGLWQDYAEDWRGRFRQGGWVASGCTLTNPSLYNLTTRVAPGFIWAGGQGYQVEADIDVVHPTADATHDRIDVLTIDSSGTVTVTAGTPSASPVAPVVGVPDSFAYLGQVTIAAGVTGSAGMTVDDDFRLLYPHTWAGTLRAGRNAGSAGFALVASYQRVDIAVDLDVVGDVTVTGDWTGTGTTWRWNGAAEVNGGLEVFGTLDLDGERPQFGDTDSLTNGYTHIREFSGNGHFVVIDGSGAGTSERGTAANPWWRLSSPGSDEWLDVALDLNSYFDGADNSGNNGCYISGISLFLQRDTLATGTLVQWDLFSGTIGTTLTSVASGSYDDTDFSGGTVETKVLDLSGATQSERTMSQTEIYRLRVRLLAKAGASTESPKLWGAQVTVKDRYLSP